MKKEIFSETLYCLFIACLFIFMHGYEFNSGDQEEHLPAVYQLQDTALYPHDFFLNQANEGITVRYFYVQLVYFLSFTGNLGLILFICTLACIFISCYSFFQISKYFSDDDKVPYVSVFFIFIFFYGFTLGGNNIQYPVFICSTVAKAVASVALLQFFREKYYTSVFLLGIASLFQLLVGLQLMLVISVYRLWEMRKDNFLKLTLWGLLYLLVASPILYPIFKDQFVRNAVYDKDLFYELLFKYRAAMHYWPAVFPLKDYLQVGFLMITGVVLLRLYSIKNSGFIWVLLFLIPFLMLLHVVGFYVPSLHILAFFQWFKTSIWLNAFLCITIAAVIIRFIPTTLYRKINPSIISYFTGIGSVILLFMITNSAAMPFARFEYSYQVGNHTKSNLTLMNEWIEQHLTKDAVVLTPPTESSFSCEAKRSKPISFRAVIHNASFMANWMHEVKIIYNVDVLTIDPAKQKIIHYLDGKYNRDANIPYNSSVKIDYKLINLELYEPAILPETEVHRQGNWILIKL